MTQASITIRLDSAQVTEIADAVAVRLGLAQGHLEAHPITESNPLTPEPQTAWSGDTSQQQAVSPQQVPADPWAAQPAPSTQSAPVQPAASVPTVSPPANNVPTCNHGPMRYVQGGVAQTGPRAGMAYPPFYACTADRNDPTKCKSVKIP